MDFENYGLFKSIDIDKWVSHELFAKSSHVKLEEEANVEKTMLTCDSCDTDGMVIIDTYINKFGQLISIVKCNSCGHIEAICEHGTGKEIERY